MGKCHSSVYPRSACETRDDESYSNVSSVHWIPTRKLESAKFAYEEKGSLPQRQIAGNGDEYDHDMVELRAMLENEICYSFLISFSSFAGMDWLCRAWNELEQSINNSTDDAMIYMILDRYRIKLERFKGRPITLNGPSEKYMPLRVSHAENYHRLKSDHGLYDDDRLHSLYLFDQ